MSKGLLELVELPQKADGGAAHQDAGGNKAQTIANAGENTAQASASAGSSKAQAPALSNSNAVPLISGTEKPILLPPADSHATVTPAATNAVHEHPKTAKEQELEALIQKRQAIIEKLKAKNPSIAEARKKIAAMLPTMQGAGASHTMRLAQEAEHIEFTIATEADTPKKEKEMLTRLRLIKVELSKNKEMDSARKAIDSERSILRSAMGEIKTLEGELAEARRQCDAAYEAVLAERKGAFEKRQKRRDETQHRRDEAQHRHFEELRERVHHERKKQYDDELAPYMKKHDDTVSMDEICVIEKKEKKGEESASE